VMIYEGNAGGDPWTILGTFVAIGITTVSAWIVLHYGEPILHRVGRAGIMALTRVMGLLLAAVGVQFVLTGLLHTFPNL
jgi:multiple antibiotic resistance protein